MSDRLLGTMVTYGFPDLDVTVDLEIAARIGASVVEVLPEWSRLPDPTALHGPLADRQLTIHSAHGCWGHRTIRAHYIDLASTDPAVARESIDDLERCVDWLAAAAGSYLVVHPGGLSDRIDLSARRGCLSSALIELADYAQKAHIMICVENMPPGVFPGSSMAELLDILDQLNHPALALALDTGHANLTSTAAHETRSTGPRLATTHVHDNNGRQDSHEPPGHGTIDWQEWGRALDGIDYRGPIMLECIRRLRENPTLFRPEVLHPLARFSCVDQTG